MKETKFSIKVSAAFSEPSGFESRSAFRSMKKGLLSLIGIALAPVVLASLVALAAADWRQVGETEAGHKVSVSSVGPLKNNLRTALVKVEFKQPTRLPQGGAFVEFRARGRFNCRSGVAVPSARWLYGRARTGTTGGRE